MLDLAGAPAKIGNEAAQLEKSDSYSGQLCPDSGEFCPDSGDPDGGPMTVALKVPSRQRLVRDAVQPALGSKICFCAGLEAADADAYKKIADLANLRGLH